MALLGTARLFILMEKSYLHVYFVDFEPDISGKKPLKRLIVDLDIVFYFINGALYFDRALLIKFSICTL